MALNFAVSWFYHEHVLTSAVYQHLLGERLDPTRIDDYFNSASKLRTWGYFLGPVVIVVRVGFMALAVQLGFLLILVELPFRHVWRAAAWAYVAPLAEFVARAVLLRSLPATALAPADMSFVPASVASLLLDPADYRSPLYGLLGLFNGFELAWCAIMVAVLRDGKKVRTASGAAVIGTVWIVVTIARWGLVAFVNRLNT